MELKSYDSRLPVVISFRISSDYLVFCDTKYWSNVGEPLSQVVYYWRAANLTEPVDDIIVPSEGKCTWTATKYGRQTTCSRGKRPKSV